VGLTKGWTGEAGGGKELPNQGLFFKIVFTGRVIGYMLTWTTYGTWLQGDKRGYVKGGEVIRGNRHFWRLNKANQKERAVRLGKEEREIVKAAILEEAMKSGQKIYSIAVCTNHVHIAAKHMDEPIETLVARYKNSSRQALKRKGFTGRVWTKGYDKRYCFNEEALQARVDYVRRHCGAVKAGG